MNSQRTLILLGAGTEAVPIIQRVRDLGFRSVVVDGDASAPGRAVADHFVHASCYHGDRAITSLRASGMMFDGVLCAATDAPVACAEVAAAFGLPGLSVAAAQLSSDKLAQKRALRDTGIPVPLFAGPMAYRLLWTMLCIDHITAGAEAWVIKPVDSRGGRGVIRLLLGVDPAWAYEEAKSHSPTGRVMVEQWLDGPQLSTESIVRNGRVLFTAVGLRNYARLGEFAPFVIEDGFDEPWGSDEEDIEIIISELIEQACRALGWYQQGAGTVKGDLIIHNSHVYVIELAARLSGGFFATHGHLLVYGIDLVGAAIVAALGYTLEEPRPYARGFVSQRYVFPTREDIGKTITRMRTAGPPLNDWPGKSEFATWNIKPSDIIQPVDCHPARWGQALATGHTPDEARTRAEAAVAAMRAGVILK